MSEIDTGGPAFPTENAAQTGSVTWRYEGMSLRDYFAAKALQGRMAGDYPWSDLGFKPVSGLSAIENEAALAYQLADAMLAARAPAKGDV